MDLKEIRRRYLFPDPFREDCGDLLAVGGDLRPERLLAAYSRGIFPWFDENSPILWWSPDPRLILKPSEFRIPSRLKRQLGQKPFVLTVNSDFSQVIRSCAGVERKGSSGTWIVPEMIEAYTRLHKLGYAHSVEAWQGKRLVGGVYGVALGRIFFGESMFYRVSNASKAALAGLMHLLEKKGFLLLDCQQTTAHMLRFGSREIPRRLFLRLVREGIGPFHESLLQPGWDAGILEY
ncbi:MAG: leucyl/phenylalanyl-tRNA--protein transferase [Desulfohalobiaceae bacterium]|nr:leucyl/phenylalanyl-tRNA--protein transferase [Desulfohalobiaceae bacterium]MCF8105463.1 leucyl/phenylalanyl-tRNA--protein transferase [Desulfohalobiaceae bacterium]